jgi:hypothetical protein
MNEDGVDRKEFRRKIRSVLVRKPKGKISKRRRKGNIYEEVKELECCDMG